MQRIVALLAVALAFGVSVVEAQDQAASLSIASFMTAKELEDTGVGSLNASQLAALDRWLTQYTDAVFKVASGASGAASSSPRYVGVGGGHWISSKVDGGAMVELEDGSLWSINAVYRIYTSLWLPISNITVVEADDAVGDFRYWLINTDDGERALAKFLGHN